MGKQSLYAVTIDKVRPLPEDPQEALAAMEARVLVSLKECKVLPILMQTLKHQTELRNLHACKLQRLNLCVCVCLAFCIYTHSCSISGKVLVKHADELERSYLQLSAFKQMVPRSNIT